MKINPRFKLRTVAGENIIVSQGQVGAGMTKIISLNASACLLYKKLEGKEFSIDDAAEILRMTYKIEKELAVDEAAAKLSYETLS